VLLASLASVVTRTLRTLLDLTRCRVDARAITRYRYFCDVDAQRWQFGLKTWVLVGRTLGARRTDPRSSAVDAGRAFGALDH
jgi:hypothetical protein